MLKCGYAVDSAASRKCIAATCRATLWAVYLARHSWRSFLGGAATRCRQRSQMTRQVRIPFGLTRGPMSNALCPSVSFGSLSLTIGAAAMSPRTFHLNPETPRVALVPAIADPMMCLLGKHVPSSAPK